MKTIPIIEVRKKLNEVSPTYCLAKWLQSTTTLFNGMTHSCHHPGQHKIDPESVKENFRALHNTPVKLHARQEMIDGIQTKECDYCWRIENIGNDSIFSDRINKSSESWSWNKFNDIVNSGVGENIMPTYLEVSFENTCNFACYYCLPEISSRILGETHQYGPYQLSNGEMQNDISHLIAKGSIPIKPDEYNPYVEAFWKWWPDLKLNLHTFRITGGEPLLSKHTWKIFDDLIANPNKELTFAINSNLGVPDKLVNKLLEYIPKLACSVKHLIIYTSAEATGKHQEYSRFGMNWEEFAKNCENVCKTISDKNNVDFIFMATVNVLATPTFHNFLDFVLLLKQQYATRPNQIVVSVNFLRHPEFGSIVNLSDNEKEKYSTIWKKYSENLNFVNIERNQIARLIEFMCSSPQSIKNLQNFQLFFEEYDKRRNTSFKSTFIDL